MKIAKTEVREALFKMNEKQNSNWHEKHIDDVACAGEKTNFLPSNLTVRKLRDQFGLKGSNNVITPIVKAMNEVVEELIEQKQQDDEKVQENALPLYLKAEFVKLEVANLAAFKAARQAVGQALIEQNNRFYTESNQKLGQASSDYEKRITQISKENKDLRMQVEEYANEVSVIRCERQMLTDTIGQLAEENKSLREQASAKEQAEKEVERLLGRLDVYESFPKPTAHRLSSTTKK
jgi:hypothetical protein